MKQLMLNGSGQLGGGGSVPGLLPLRIGLFGGSFDPVHYGHLLIATAAVDEMQLDRLVFIPAARSPFKETASAAPPQSRLRLLRLALAGRSQYRVDAQEIERGGFQLERHLLQRLATVRKPARDTFETDHLPVS